MKALWTHSVHIFFFSVYPKIKDLLLVYLPFLFLLCEANPLSSIYCGSLGSSQDVLLSFLKLLSVCFPFFCPSTTNFLISSSLEAILSVCLRCLPLFGHTLPTLLFRFLLSLSLKWHRENKASWPLTVCRARQPSHSLSGPPFSPQFTEEACLELRDCKLAACVWPTGE